jgi:hypothetical protein
MALIRARRKRERGSGREQCRHGGATIPDGEELAGVTGSGATALHLQNQRYREEAEVKARPHRGKSRPGDMTGATVAMDGGERLAGARENCPRGHHSRDQRNGEIEGNAGCSPRQEEGRRWSEDGESRRVEDDGALCCGFSVAARA